MEIAPSKRRITPRATKFPILFNKKSSIHTNAQQNDENIAPISNYRMSDKSSLVVKKSMATFQKSLNQSRFYLAQFGNKVQHIYERQLYRSYLKERSYSNLAKKMEIQKQKVESQIARIREENQKQYKDILEENQKLQELKKNYIKILQKNIINLKNQTDQYNQIIKKNDGIKQKIKEFWKKLPFKEEMDGKKTRELSQVIMSKNHTNKDKNWNNMLIKTGSVVSQQDESIYITHNAIQSSERKSIKTKNDKLTKDTQESLINQNIKKQLQQLSLMSNSSLKVHRMLKQDSLRGYQQAIKKIQKLQISILQAKRRPNKKQNVANSAPSQLAIRKQRIRQRIQQVQYKNQIVKLFIIYLKGNQSKQNKTGLQNLPKIIFYLQKVLKDKQDTLKQVKEMGKNLQI